MGDAEEFAPPGADRPPTPDEELAAARSADNVDLERVGEHYEHANQLGAHAKGEGQIEPEPDHSA